jgi:hypothetical protein
MLRRLIEGLFLAVLVWARAAAKGEDDGAVEREMLALRGRQHARGAELTFWTGFIMGGAIAADMPTPLHGGEMGDGGLGGIEGAAVAQASEEARHLSDLIVDRRVLIPVAFVVLVLAYCSRGRGRCRPNRAA